VNRSHGPKGQLLRQRLRGDDGVALVEFALVSPVLFLLLFGIIDFGWVFGQHLDVRHGVREGARLVSVNYDPNGYTGTTQTQAIALEICGRMDNSGATTVAISNKSSGSDAGKVGQYAIVTVRTEADPLTGFLPMIFDGIDLVSTVEVRIEVDATWAGGLGAITCL
jgi:Flp pilus assembly protein TadG